MGCFTSKEENSEKEVGVTERRKIRDVLCLFLFIVFWAGMFVILGFSAARGDVDRLVYGVDSYGFLCGSSTKWQGVTFNLTERKNLYFLNGLDLLEPTNFLYAKSICVEECPTGKSRCNTTNLPCKDEAMYRCPYYRFAEDNLYGSLVNVRPDDTMYFSELLSTNKTNCSSSIPSGSLKYTADFGTSNCGQVFQLSSQYNSGPCYPIFMSTVEYFNRCFPDGSVGETKKSVVKVLSDGALGSATKLSDTLKAKLTDSQSLLSQYVGDLKNGFEIIIIAGLGAGFVLSLVWVVLLRLLAGLIAWLTVILINLVLLGFTLWSFAKSGRLGDAPGIGQTLKDLVPTDADPSANDRKVWLWIGVAFAICTGLCLLLTLLMIRRIAIAVACIKVASQAIGHIPTLLVYPLIPFVLVSALYIYWLWITALMWSAGDLKEHHRDPQDYQALSIQQLYTTTATGVFSPPPPRSPPPPAMNRTATQQFEDCAVDPNCYYSYTWTSQYRYAFIYHVFGLLWTHQFIIGCAYVTVACAVGYFYWSRGDASGMPRHPLLKAMRVTLFFHLGSVAFGAAIVAVVQLVRLIFEYIVRRSRAITQNNAALQWVVCCARCFLWCLESILQFINRNAFVLIGIRGKNYCTSATQAVKLIVSNAIRIVVVNIVSDVLIWMAKVTIAVGCGLAAFALSSADRWSNKVDHPKTYVTSPVFPVFFSMIFGYLVASVFFAVYEMTVDTIFLCFCQDCDMNDGQPKYAPPLLMQAIGEVERHGQATAEKYQMKNEKRNTQFASG